MKYLLICLLIFTFVISNAQENFNGPDPEIGKLFPNYTFKDVQYSPKRTYNTKEAKGKWLILDFWNVTCSACINSFPENNKIFTKYKAKVDFISVAFTGSMAPDSGPSDSTIRLLYKGIYNKYHFNFPVAFDSILYNKFEIGGVGCPYIIIIDPKGYVRMISDGLKEKDISRLFKEDFSSLKLISRLAPKKNSILTDSSLIYLNSISWSDKYSSAITTPFLFYDTSKSNTLTIQGSTLDYIYRFAFFGKISWDQNDNEYDKIKYFPILEMTDSSLFERDKRFQFKLKIPERKTKMELMELLKKALFETFGYHVSIEERKVPIWKVAVIDSMKKSIVSKGGPPEFKSYGKFSGFSFKNMPMLTLINHLAANFQVRSDGKGIGQPPGRGRPFVDESGITQNIDIDIHAFTEDFKEFSAALKNKGIIIEDGEKKMLCMVINKTN